MPDLAVEMRSITKNFPGARALDRVSFNCRVGEVHALVGENGAGKSTLMKILAGALQPDAGEILLHGHKVHLSTPADACRLGIGIIYQEFDLLPWLSVTENILLGRLPSTRLGIIDWKRARKETQESLDRLGAQLDHRRMVADLSVAQQQIVEIAKALSLNARVVIMDEPSAVLAGHELERLFEVIHTLKEEGVSIIYISHRLDEIFEIADRATVLRDGEVAGTVTVRQTDKATLIRMMVGRILDEALPSPCAGTQDTVLEVKSLSSSRTGLRDISLQLRKGEILGIAGLVGAGRTELVRAIFGADSFDSGEVQLDGRRVSIGRPRDAIQLGLALVPEDRKAQGLVLCLSLRKNVALPILDRLTRFLFIDRARETSVIQSAIDNLGIKTSNPEQEVQYLSGGNQQKVVLAKWLGTTPRVIIMDEPTRGIDVGAKAEVYHLTRQLAARGTGIIMISSELPEIIGMSDRILVMCRGRIAGELSRSEATEEKILTLAVGGAAAVEAASRHESAPRQTGANPGPQSAEGA